MTHLSDDDLVLHHYGEETDGRPHLAACVECAARYHELSAVLAQFVVQEPERDEDYGAGVWRQLRPRLPEPRPWWHVPIGRTHLAALASAALLLLAVGFAAGRFWLPPAESDEMTASLDPATETARRRVLLLTVADHLERSDRMLTDLVNAAGGTDISVEQQWAADLVAGNRLYRHEAMDTNEPAVVGVLDELERTLLEIVHGPSTVTAADLDDIRRQLDSAALLFKVRVVRDELRDRELAPVSGDSIPTISTIG